MIVLLFILPWRYNFPIRSMSKAEDCLLYTSDAADERSSVDLGGRRIIKKKNNIVQKWLSLISQTT